MERPFTYRITKDDKLIVYRDNRQISILKGARSRRFIDELPVMDEADIQQRLARLTGHYKHGNER